MSAGNDLLTEQFEQNRARLRRWPTGCSARSAEADDAVQETWLRLNRAGDRDRQPRRLADHGRRPGLPGHAALAHDPPRGRRSSRRRRAAPARRTPIPHGRRELADSVGRGAAGRAGDA